MGSQKKENNGNKRFFHQVTKVKLVCSWSNCKYVNHLQIPFYSHVTSHLVDLEIVCDEDGEENYECRWAECTYNSQDPKNITRHLKYHAFHTRIKSVGSLIKKRKNLPDCTFIDSESNSIPAQNDPLICQWSCCGEECPGQPEYINHVLKVHLIPLKEKRRNATSCKWADCKIITSTKHKLIEHVRVHTGEKVIACPTCGHMFSNTTKFADHCNRQLESRAYQCTHCLGYFPTERILTHHMRQHVHHYKCLYCDMTCSTPSILATHIRYRHLNYKPFKCPTCSCCFKSRSDLRTHTLSHNSGWEYICNEADCEFSSRSQSTLTRHFEKVHVKNRAGGSYSCHMCDKKYTRGAVLTKHLLSFHGVIKPLGFSRFIYKHDEDGYRRLQTTRLESLEVTADMEKPLQILQDSTSQSMSEDEEEEDDPNEEEENEPQQIVTVDVLDEGGNVVTSETVLTGKKLSSSK